MEAAVTGVVRALDVRWLTAPDGAGALGAAEQILLVVGGAENVIPNEAERQHGEGVDAGELHRVVHQVQTLQSIYHINVHLLNLTAKLMIG